MGGRRRSPDDRRAVILALAEAAVNEVATFRARLSHGLAAVQDSVRDLEASARVIRNFQPGIIPGLLQTADYARRIMAFADITTAAATAPPWPPASAASRPSTTRPAPSSSWSPRRRCATGPARRCSHRLVRRPASRITKETLTAQLDHLAAVATLETITFGVIPADAQMHAITRCGFILYEDRTGDQPPVAADGDPARLAAR